MAGKRGGSIRRYAKQGTAVVLDAVSTVTAGETDGSGQEGPGQDDSGQGVQWRDMRKDGWTPARRALFMETLQETANIAESARAAGKAVSSAYAQKKRDPAFARDWAQALAVGYDELSALLLRQALFGTEQEEVTTDAEGAVKSRKVRRSHPVSMAFRLLQAHRQEVAEQRAIDVRDRPDGADAVERLRLALDLMRARIGGNDEGAA